MPRWSRHCGPITDQGQISGEEWFDPPGGQDVFHVASKDGRTYMLDAATVLSSSSDLMVSLATDLSCLVVGAGAETVSGTFWFTAADRGQLRRLHFNVEATVTEPFDMGDALPSEGHVPWNDIDGAGIMARLDDLGFDVAVLRDGPSDGRRLLWAGETMPESGELDGLIAAHCEQHGRPDIGEWTGNVVVHTRATEGPKRSRLKRLFTRG